MNCESDEQQLIDIFGIDNAQIPSEFKFRRGDIVLIKALVTEVNKIIGEKGYNTFQCQIKNRKRRGKQSKTDSNPNIRSNKMRQKSENAITVKSNDISTQHLKRSLFAKIQECLDQYSAHRLVEYDYLDENTVAVHQENGNIFGSITCIICQHLKKKNNPKRMYYHEKNDLKESSYWVISNFHAHLRTHGLKPLKLAVNQTKKEDEDENTNSNSKENNSGDDSLIEIIDDANTANESVIIVKEECAGDFNSIKTHEAKTIQGTWLYEQFCHQVNSMVGAVLFNGDAQEKMICVIASEEISVTVATIQGDGNCLFSSFVHQIFKHTIG